MHINAGEGHRAGLSPRSLCPRLGDTVLPAQRPSPGERFSHCSFGGKWRKVISRAQHLNVKTLIFLSALYFNSGRGWGANRANKMAIKIPNLVPESLRRGTGQLFAVL